MGLQAVSWPFPKMRKGLPFLTRANWPDNDLKKAVGLTMEYVKPEAINSFSNASLAC